MLGDALGMDLGAEGRSSKGQCPSGVTHRIWGGIMESVQQEVFVSFECLQAFISDSLALYSQHFGALIT